MQIKDLLLLFTLISCGAPATKTVSDYVYDFSKDINTNVKSKIYFDNLPEGVAGRCFPVLNIIQLDLDFYIKASDIERRAVIYHELGHCYCSLRHDTEMLNFCPKYLMYPSMSPTFCYKQNWKKYINRLRSKCQK